MFWNRKKEEPEVLDIAGLINEGDQQGKVYTSIKGVLIEAGTMNKNGDIFINLPSACSGNIEIPNHNMCSGYALQWSHIDDGYIKVPSTKCSG